MQSNCMRNLGRGALLGPDWGVVACWCVIFSPRSSCWWRKRYKVLPAGEKWAEISVLGRAGRILYRVGRRAGRAGRVLYRVGPSGVCAGRVFYRYRPPRPRAGTVLYRKRLCMRDKVLPARVVGGESGKKFSLRAKSGPKSAFWGVPGEFCTGWAAEPGGRESFVPGGPSSRAAGRVLSR